MGNFVRSNKVIDIQVSNNCPYCFEPLNNQPWISLCECHGFHLECLRTWMINQENCSHCEICRSERIIPISKEQKILIWYIRIIFPLCFFLTIFLAPEIELDIGLKISIFVYYFLIYFIWIFLERFYRNLLFWYQNKKKVIAGFIYACTFSGLIQNLYLFYPNKKKDNNLWIIFSLLISAYFQLFIFTTIGCLISFKKSINVF